jgi:glycosyltransferase involved in cell wall biosynthesis
LRVAVVAGAELGARMSSAGIRATELARQLEREHEVALVAPGELVRTRLERFDAVVAQMLPPAEAVRLARSRTRVIFDLYIPAITETLASRSLAEPLRRAGVLAQEVALATGDAFICASERQRDLWLGMLSDLGRLDAETYAADPTLRDVVDVVPFGLPEEEPRGEPVGLKRDGARVLLWAGGISDWLDPLTPIRAVEQLEDVKLVFLARGPDTDAARRAAQHESERVVFVRDWVPYAARTSYLLEADLGVSAHFDSVETRFAFRTRLLDHFWARLPTVTTGGDVLAELVEERGLGKAVPARDVAAYAEAIVDLLAAPPPAKRFDDVREELAWPRVVAPLLRLLAGERSPPPARTARLRLEQVGLRARLRLRRG